MLKRSCFWKPFRIECVNKVAGLWPATLFKKRCFPVNFEKFLRTPFLQNISGRLLLKKNKIRLIENQSWGTKVDVRKSKNIKLYASQSKNKVSYNIRKKRLVYKNFKTCLTVFTFFNEPFIFIILCIW